MSDKFTKEAKHNIVNQISNISLLNESHKGSIVTDAFINTVNKCLMKIRDEVTRIKNI